MRLKHVLYATGTTFWLVLSLGAVTPSERVDARSLQEVRAESPAAPADLPVTLEFDLPENFSARSKDDAYVITGFRIGVFKPKGNSPVTTIDFTRDQVTVNGRSGRVSIDRGKLPQNIDGRVLRVQTLSGQVTSLWSDPSPSVSGAPKAGRGSKNERATAKKTEKHLTLADIEPHPRLLEALRKALPSDVKPDDVAARYRTTEELALSIVLAEQEKISLEKLSAVMKGPPQKNIRAALQEIRSSLDAKRAVKKARQPSKALLETSK
jgi:hypothetical protein